MRNRITDVPGLAVGNAEDRAARTGVSVVVFERPAIAAADIRGGAPGTRETDLLALENAVEAVDAIVLSGGSAFGLEAASGVMAHLAARGRGFPVGGARVPIVPAAILFDLTNGGDKDWGARPPYRALGETAVAAAAPDFAQGSAGAGFGARTNRLRGGLGTASAREEAGACVGALVAVNPVGGVTIGDGPHFWAGPFEREAEFGGLGLPSPWPAGADRPALKGAPAGASTTLAIVATDARLTKPQAKRLAIMAQDGLARAILPAHTPLDGDIVFAAATGSHDLADPLRDLARLGALAANVLARAVARAVYEADSSQGMTGMPPAWRDRFG